MKTTISLAGIAMLALLEAVPAAAQDYPVKPVRLLVTLPPGSSSDIVARVLGDNLSRALGQQFLVDNRPGAAGNVAAAAAAKAPPDGYTLFVSTFSTHGTNPSLYSQLGFEPVRDFVPVVLLASNPNVLVVLPSTPIKSVKELIALARARPGDVTYSSGVPGFDVSAWFGLSAPARTPEAIVRKLNAESNKVLATPAVRDNLNNQGMEVHGGSPQDYGSFINAELARWAKVVKTSGIKLD